MKFEKALELVNVQLKKSYPSFKGVNEQDGRAMIMIWNMFALVKKNKLDDLVLIAKNGTDIISIPIPDELEDEKTFNEADEQINESSKPKKATKKDAKGAKPDVISATSTEPNS